jgi:hypothetical protein
MAIAAVGALLASIGIHVQNEASGLTVGTDRRPHPAFLVRSDHSEHDAERRLLFDKELRGKCDVVDAFMMSPRIWFAKCGSGDRVVFGFKRDGRLEHAASPLALTSSHSPSDEQLRRHLFDEYLAPKCGVIYTHMESPGRWTAVCRSGRRFRLLFDEGYLSHTAESR